MSATKVGIERHVCYKPAAALVETCLLQASRRLKFHEALGFRQKILRYVCVCVLVHKSLRCVCACVLVQKSLR